MKTFLFQTKKDKELNTLNCKHVIYVEMYRQYDPMGDLKWSVTAHLDSRTIVYWYDTESQATSAFIDINDAMNGELDCMPLRSFLKGANQ